VLPALALAGPAMASSRSAPAFTVVTSVCGVPPGEGVAVTDSVPCPTERTRKGMASTWLSLSSMPLQFSTPGPLWPSTMPVQLTPAGRPPVPAYTPLAGTLKANAPPTSGEPLVSATRTP